MIQENTISTGAPLAPAVRVLLGLGGLLVVGVLVWQAITSSGSPDPAATQHDPAARTEIGRWWFPSLLALLVSEVRSEA